MKLISIGNYTVACYWISSSCIGWLAAAQRERERERDCSAISKPNRIHQSDSEAIKNLQTRSLSLPHSLGNKLDVISTQSHPRTPLRDPTCLTTAQIPSRTQSFQSQHNLKSIC